MLRNKLLRVNKGGGGGLVYVGGATGFTSSNTYNHIIDLTSLTGGIASSAIAGDVLLIAIAQRSTNNITFTCAGGEVLADLYINSSNHDTNFGFIRKVLTGNDTSVTINTSVNTVTNLCVQVWRGFITPYRFWSKMHSKLGSLFDDWDDPTLSDPGYSQTLLVTAQGGADGGSTLYTAPADSEHFIGIGAQSASKAGVAISSRIYEGTYTFKWIPSNMGGGLTATLSSSAAYQVAFIPDTLIG